jgi:SagB-type dehydrogenase family enzyme
MRIFYVIISFIVLAIFPFRGFAMEKTVNLPLPKKDGKISLESALDKRKSLRRYAKGPLQLEEVSQILWAAYGKNKWGKITSPSAGALYPLSIYLAVGEVKNLPSGLYLYNNQKHSLTMISAQDIRRDLSRACLGQSFIAEAAVVLVICANYNITASRYTTRAKRYVDIETGHVGQNVYLQVTVLGLGTVAVGAFSDEEVKKVLNTKESPLYVMPIGRDNE